MDHTLTENSTPEQQNRPSRWEGKLKLVLRLLIYGMPLLLLLYVLVSLAIPPAKPKAVLRVEAECRLQGSPGQKITPSRMNRPSPIQSTPSKGAMDLGTQTFKKLTHEPPLIPERHAPPSLQPEVNKWNQQYCALLLKITGYEQAASGLSLQDADGKLRIMFMELWGLTKGIDQSAHNLLAGAPNRTEDWNQFTAPVFKQLQGLWTRLAEDTLENLIRHRRWVAAAWFCEHELHDGIQASYYWRQWGGRRGYFQVAALSIGRLWDPVMRRGNFRQGIYWTEIMNLFPTPFDDQFRWSPPPVLGPTPPGKPLPYIK